MALNIRIDFKNKYDPVLLDSDLRNSTFESVLVDGTTVTLGIKISTKAHPFMPNVYNLAFGPIDDNFKIDDRAKLTHRDHSRVFSTIVFAALSFLKTHKDKYLGIDGSNAARAYMYYRCILKNYEYLNSFFNIYGVDYYLKVLRDESSDYGPEDVLMKLNLIAPGENIPGRKLYNYIIFNERPGE